MNFSKKILSSFIFAGVLLALPLPVSAGCTTQYGGTVTCPPTDLTINKLVAKPRIAVVNPPAGGETKGGDKKIAYEGALNFRENLDISTELAHRAGTEVVFKLIVHNGSNKTFSNIRVVDKLPDFIRLESYPGKLDGKTLEYFIDKLEPGAKHEQELYGFIFDRKDITGPENFCLSNRGEVNVEDRAHNDSAQLCVIKEEPAKKLPVSGVNDLVLMIPFIGLGLSGLTLLRKRS